jgi:para-aminobenzoate synthetase component 1
MECVKEIQVNNSAEFRSKLSSWLNEFETGCLLDSNSIADTVQGHKDKYSSYDFICAAGTMAELVVHQDNGAFEKLKKFYEEQKGWLFGFLSYDLKNDTEELTSVNADHVGMPALHFFKPQIIFLGQGTQVRLIGSDSGIEELELVVEQINNQKPHVDVTPNIQLSSRLSKKDYIEGVKSIKSHLYHGDIYELNFCQEFYATSVQIDPLSTFNRLNNISQTPFSCYYRVGDKHLICGSPERFLKKDGNKLISQPIKGTTGRGHDDQSDQLLKESLMKDPKEQSENVMIVDLVRNDLSRSAIKGSVQVEELFGIYPFNQMYQMISTVTSELHDDIHLVDAIKGAFPMGSMTGAPKVRAMELIEQYESTKRGLYSGAVGYFTPEGNFDFNVVIRSILYNSQKQYLSAMVGGAITALSIPEKEYDECLLKAKPLFNTFNSLANGK